MNEETVEEILEQFYAVLNTPEQYGFYHMLKEHIEECHADKIRLEEEVRHWQDQCDEAEDYWIKLK